jgi:hypothetical protein
MECGGVDAITDDPADVDVDVVLLGAAGPATGVRAIT